MEILIETERLLIRELLPTDVEGMFDLDSNPEVHQYLGKQPVKSKEETLDVIDFIRQQYSDNGIARWVMVDKETNDFIGWTGFKYVTESTNNHVNYYDLGYRLRQKYWGKGIATEAAIACLNYGFNQLGFHEVFAMADCDNEGSNNILKKLGFSRIETFDLDGVPHHWYRLDKSDFNREK
ncbi:GNAT family N-acetyltransferase [Myroides sp. WP-1]|uniref:GNAT family N-acetyltransferase n=1 Tax=Myroides sp. WP-1 TaxID=2759944 RepID=UPI0015FD9FCB|nr:GNAT family N-acetyltransferase [Myroides sp. WP-1]MBB1137899.1 GNAT family N-acetyltransferase [Myroides sp. WP-1]